MGLYSWDTVYIVLHAHALLLGEVVGMVLEWMVKQQFNFFAQLECEMSSLTSCHFVKLDLTFGNCYYRKERKGQFLKDSTSETPFRSLVMSFERVHFPMFVFKKDAYC